MQSCIARIVQFISERYKACISDILQRSSAGFTGICATHNENNLDPQVLCQTRLVHDRVMATECFYFLSDIN